MNSPEMTHRKKMRLAAFLLALAPLVAMAQHEGEYEHPHNDVSDTQSLQRGARYFVNYCLGCHSAQYVRYNRVAEDLGIPEEELTENLMFTGERPFDTMQIAMSPEDAERWFGVEPPDMSLLARSKGTDYIYSFLRGFYASPDRPTGVDNTVLAGTAMPHVLWELQGVRDAVFTTDEFGNEHFEHFEPGMPGQLTSEEYDAVVRDIVNFLDYISEPMQLERQALGIRVIAFLLVFLVLAYMLKREIWSDVK
jgi:ubiquinol-cytochrome c reductase cytochrome c1 subunit